MNIQAVLIHSQNPTPVAIHTQRFFAGHTEIDQNSLGGNGDLLAGWTQRFIHFDLVGLQIANFSQKSVKIAINLSKFLENMNFRRNSKKVGLQCTPSQPRDVRPWLRGLASWISNCWWVGAKLLPSQISNIGEEQDFENPNKSST